MILGFIPARYVLAVMGSIGMAIVYGLKVNLSVAMVGMLNHTALALEGSHHDTVGNVTAVHDDGMEDCGDSGGNGTSVVEVSKFNACILAKNE